jgi:peptidyl-prolyl cis-trans isomerase A (cyclophilin A)
MTVRLSQSGSIVALILLASACGRERPAAAAADTGTATAAATQSSDTAPATFHVNFVTSAGDFVMEVHREWAPRGADRLYTLVKAGYYDGVRFFRVLPGFMAQFGINGDPRVWTQWARRRIPDDPVRERNTRGMVSFATAGANTRTAQLFINYLDNSSMLDGQGFAPIGRVVTGMDVVDRLFAGYGEGAPEGHGPDQQRIWAEGNAYLEREFPKLDYIKRATIVGP